MHPVFLAAWVAAPHEPSVRPPPRPAAAPAQLLSASAVVFRRSGKQRRPSGCDEDVNHRPGQPVHPTVGVCLAARPRRPRSSDGDGSVCSQPWSTAAPTTGGQDCEPRGTDHRGGKSQKRGKSRGRGCSPRSKKLSRGSPRRCSEPEPHNRGCTSDVCGAGFESDATWRKGRAKPQALVFEYLGFNANDLGANQRLLPTGTPALHRSPPQRRRALGLG